MSNYGSVGKKGMECTVHGKVSRAGKEGSVYVWESLEGERVGR